MKMATEFDFTPYAVGGATRPDSFSGLSPEFRSALAQMLQSAPEDVRAGLHLMSGYRSPERQAVLYRNAVQKYGSPEAARKWVAPPGNSQHNHGSAVDFKWGNDAAKNWVHQNAQQFGLNFPLSNEDWHIEPIGARSGHGHSPSSTIAANTQIAPGAPAPALGPARTIQDRPVMPAQDQVQPAAPQMAAAPEQSPIGALFANMQPMASGFSDAFGGAEQKPSQMVYDGSSELAAQNGMVAAQNARGLLDQLNPNVDQLLSLGAKKKAGLGIV